MNTRPPFVIFAMAAVMLTMLLFAFHPARAAGPWYVAQAASITVNTTTDELNSDGDCSLREAIQAANTDAVVDACPAGSGADTIILPTGTYTLTLAGADEDGNATGDLDITDTLTLDGADMAATIINANAIDRALHVPTVGVTLTLLNLTVRNGNVEGPGGGLYATGPVVVSNTTFLSNTTGYGGSGGGAYFGDTATVTDAAFTSNTAGIGGVGGGGGAYFGGAATVTGAIFTSNKADYSSGGGAYFDGIATVTGATFTDNYRSGIYNHNSGTLTLNNSTVSGNSLGGIRNDGTLTLNNSTVSGNTDDGIYNIGLLTLNNSTVSGNTSSQRGGGIYNYYGTLTLNNSTVSGNTVYSDGYGGGIANMYGTLTLNNSTVSGNTSSQRGGGIFNLTYGIATLNNSTITGNTSQGGGGISSNYSGTMTLKNSILAGNIAAGVAGGPDCLSVDISSAGISSSGYNLIGNTTDCNFTPSVGDLTNDNANLGELINSPGYHPLLPGSPAIDAGNPAGCNDNLGNPLTTDQRGASRVGICDMGAYEYTLPGPANSIVVLSGSPQHTVPLTAFALSLRAAVLDSIGSPVSNMVVTFSAPASGASGTFAASGIYTTTEATNAGGVVTATTFTANEVRGAYVVTAMVSGVITPANFLLSNLAWYVTPAGNDSNDCQTPSTTCATINGALTKGDFLGGDMVFVASGTYTSDTGSEVVLIDKSATLSGGWDATFTTQGGMSTIDAGGVRRGITINSNITVVVDRFVVQNGYSSYGGGIYNDGTLTLNNSTVSGTTDQYLGGGIYNNNYGTLTLNNSTVSNNAGGGIYNNSILTLNNSTVSGNTSSSSSVVGGIYNYYSGILTLNNSTVSGNTNSGSGGGISNSGTLTVTNSTISGNTGSSGGGGISNSGTLTITNSTISGNTDSGFGGGGLYNGGTLTLNNSTVSGNTSTNSYWGGSGISNYGGTLTLRNSILAGNTAHQNGTDCYGTISSASFNLIGNTSGCTFTPGTGDLTNLDAKLWSSLMGSPGYHPLLPSSPAIDGGNPAGCTDDLGNPLPTDQRGIARVGPCDIGAFEYDPNNDPLTYVFLPTVRRPKLRIGINGTVTENGAPATGVSLDLRFYNGSSWSTLAITTTDADGDYFFTGISSLIPGQYYYVRYLNTTTPSRLYTWHTPSLSAYAAGSNVYAGGFDIANIELVSPPAGATVPLPYTFQWTRRTATTTDSYEFNLFDYDDSDPYFYTVPPLGYVGSYTLTGLPPGFVTGFPYVWDMWVYGPDGGYGISYWAYYVTFSSSGFTLTTLEQHHPADKLDDMQVDVWEHRLNQTRP